MSETLHTQKNRLGDVLVEQGLLTQDQLKEAVAEQKRNGEQLPVTLIKKEFISEEDIVVTLSELLGIPHFPVSKVEVPEDVLAKVPANLARDFRLVPVSQTGTTLTVAMVDPLNILAIDDLKMVTHCEIEPVVSLNSEIEDAIKKWYEGAEPIKQEEINTDNIDDWFDTEELEAVKEDEEDEIDISQLKEQVEQAPVVRLVNVILIKAIKKGASDIHIEPYEKDLRVRYRIDGVLDEVLSPPRAQHPALVSRLKILSQMDIAERRKPQDGRFKIKFEGRQIDLRVSILPTGYGEKVVMRILDKGALTLDVAKLGFGEQQERDFRESIEHPYGMVLLTGPTGSGKTTTLYSALTEVNRPEVNIVTVEDPIEYDLHGINQVQVRPEVDLTFANGLRSILRQDPDIVMVGEIRDEETADIAVKAALTGHLVLSTLHTNDAAGAITRLIDMGIEPFLVSSSLLTAAAQRLLRKICSTCKQVHEVPESVLERAQFPSEKRSEATFYRGRGCPHCNATGYKGRLAILEVLRVHDPIRDMIINHASAAEIKQEAIKLGMQSLRQDGLAKAADGLTTLEEVLRVTATD